MSFKNYVHNKSKKNEILIVIFFSNDIERVFLSPKIVNSKLLKEKCIMVRFTSNIQKEKCTRPPNFSKGN